MKAFIMAGGRATRFGASLEKGMLEVGGRTMLERTVSALRGAGIDHVNVAVTEATPKTADMARRIGANPVHTGGRGYHDDVIELLEDNNQFVSLNVDLPFVSSEHVKTLMSNEGRGSVTAVVPARLALSSPRAESLMTGEDGAELVCIGLNIVTPDPDIFFLVLDDPLLTVNVNDEENLMLANRLAQQRGI